VATRPKKIKCAKCGVSVAVARVGRLPKFCPNHRKGGGGECLDKDARKKRLYKRREAKKQGAKVAAIAVNLDEAKDLAIGMLQHPTSLTNAAESAGMQMSEERLLAVAEVARAEFAGIIDGDLGAFARQCQAALFTMVTKISKSVRNEEIAPRDLPHCGRAVAQISSLITGDDNAPRYSSIELFVTGADGKPIKLGGDA